MSEPRFDDKPIAMLRRVGREALATKMIGLFLASAPGRVNEIAGALASGDLEAARRGAHSLKPSAGQLGATRLSDVCQRLEDAATGGDVTSAGALLPDLRAELALAIEWLQTGAPTNPAAE
jgi:HPt (histidine-containing phosphotransfer) domain-containing protein